MPRAPFLFGIGFAVFSILLGSGLWASAGIGLFGYAVARVLFFQDRPLPVRWLIILFASLQWVVAAQLAYGGAYEHFKYFMYVPEGIYMPIVVFGLFAFLSGLFAVGNQMDKRRQLAAIAAIPSILRAHPRLPFVLLGISALGTLFWLIFPSGLNFVAYLAVNLKYTAAIMLILSDRKDRHLWVGGVFGLAFLEAAASSLFHDVMLWSVLVGSFYAFRLGLSKTTRTLILVLTVFAGVALQSVKHDYRSLYWGTGQEGSAGEYFNLMTHRAKSIASGEVGISQTIGGVIMRLNQGWIISSVIYHVPNSSPYAYGETILRGVEATLLPRLLFPNKPTAGGRENFERFTGLALAPGASMGTSILGEAYGNFGVFGGAAFMAIFGAFLSVCILSILRLTDRMPILICFLPNMVLFALKAETDVTTVLNYVVKSGIFHVGIVFILILFFRFRLRRRNRARPLPG